MKRRLLALACALSVAGWVASTAAACHSEIAASLNCSGLVTYTATAWTGSDATTTSRTNSDVRVSVSYDNGHTYTQVGRGHFGSDDNFSFSGSFSAGSAQSAIVSVQEAAKWGNGDSPAPARNVTVTRPSNCSSGGPTCPAHDMVTSSSPIAISGGTASVSFTVAAGCQNVQLSLVSYKAPGPTYSEQTASQEVLYQSVTGTFSAGSQTMSVAVPNCYYQVDFVYGTPIEHLSGDTSGSYSKQGRLIRSLNGGTSSCTTQNTPPSAPTPPAQNTAPAPPASISVMKLERVGPTGDFVVGPVTAKVGDTIYYQIVVTNTGPAVSVSLSDTGCAGLSPTGPQGLESGKTISFTCSHTVVKADGTTWSNTATATATAASGTPTTASSTVVANIPAGGVLGTSTTVKPSTKGKNVKTVKVKRVTKRAKPARAQVRAASFTG